MTGKIELKKIYSRLKLFICLGFAGFLGVIESIPILLEVLFEESQNLSGETLFLALTWLVIFCILWFVSISAVWFFESRYSFTNHKIGKVLALHLSLILGIIFSNAALSTIQFIEEKKVRENLIRRAGTNSTGNSNEENTYGQNYSTADIFTGRFIVSIPKVFLIYSGVWGIGIGFNYYQKYQEREVRTAQLETQLAHSQLQTLKAQLQPHFLFNMLNGIAGLIRNNENQVAIETINELSTLLRYVVENAGKEMVELSEELEFNRLYLNLHQKRFSDRMQVEFDVNPETLRLEVPNLILQPLVENAIVHGIAKTISEQRIIIRSKIENNYLKLTVKNVAPKLTEDWKFEKGVGLSNTYSRLEKTYESDFSLELKNYENRCVVAEISLPIKSREIVSR